MTMEGTHEGCKEEGPKVPKRLSQIFLDGARGGLGDRPAKIVVDDLFE